MIKSIKSIEKVMYVTVFVPIILMIIIFVRALTLKGATDGILYYVTPTFGRITDIKVWIEAALMATYTLGPGWGTIPTIGSHNKFHGNTVGYSILSTFLDFLSAVLNGLICFAILGVMAHDSGLELENTVTSGLSLGFTVYPTAFTYFPLPQVWSAVFFVNLLLVGLDSQVLSTETVMNCLQDIVPRWFIGRRRVYMIILLNIIFFILTIPFCTRGGLYLFQLLDWYAAAWTLLFVCFVECIVFTWIYGCERLNRDAMIMMGRPLPIVIRLFGSFLTPAAILVLLILSFLRYTPPKYGSYIYPDSAEVIGWCLAFAIISPMFIVFIYKLITSEGSFIEKLKSIRKSSDIWGPNDEVSMTTYHDNDEIIQSEYSVKSTLTYNIFGRSHSNRRQKYSVNINDEISYPMVNCNDTYKSKPNV
ncbi:Sodium- and chloride-dependent creatine transporter 1 [Mactra antiquata]